LLLAVTLVGLVAMHQLAGSLGHPDHHPGAGAYMAADAPVCQGDDCPDGPHGHSGQVCQAPPTPSTAASTPAVSAGHDIVPDSHAGVTPVTADRAAADGSGCGPPVRAALSIWRI
jgi:hypothetical protein